MNGSTKNLIAAIALFYTGAFLGVWFGINQNKLNSVYARDFNGDNRQDLMIITKRGDKFIYIQQEDGKYKSLSELPQLEVKGIEAKLK